MIYNQRRRLVVLFLTQTVLIFKLGFGQTNSFTNSHDQKVYKTNVIGPLTWMAENLNVTKFRNGDSIPEAKSSEEWRWAGENEQPAWCYLNNDPLNETNFGKLYNFYAIIDPRGLAPAGWRIVSDCDYENYSRDTIHYNKEGVCFYKLFASNFLNNSSNSGIREYNGEFKVFSEASIIEASWWLYPTYCTYKFMFYFESFGGILPLEYRPDFPEVIKKIKAEGMSVRCVKE